MTGPATTRPKSITAWINERVASGSGTRQWVHGGAPGRVHAGGAPSTLECLPTWMQPGSGRGRPTLVHERAINSRIFGLVVSLEVSIKQDRRYAGPHPCRLQVWPRCQRALAFHAGGREQQRLAPRRIRKLKDAPLTAVIVRCDLLERSAQSRNVA